MTTADDRYKARTFQHPRFIPVSIGVLPAAWIKYREALDEIARRYPVAMAGNLKKDRDYDAVTGTYAAGRHVDAWGCEWSNACHGHEAIVTAHPVPTRAAVRTLKAPTVDAGMPHGFMYLRLMDLRGFEELMIDFAEEPPELQMLIDIVLEYNMGQLELRLADGRAGEMIHFGDDLGTQRALPMSPATWRKYLKPCYSRLYGRCRQERRPVYMHTDGQCYQIIGDLVECGVEVINPQVRANGLDNLAAVCKGKVCVDLDLDRQLFPFATPQEIDAHVREAVEVLGSPEGGLWLKGEIDEGVPLANIEAICSALETYRGYYA